MDAIIQPLQLLELSKNADLVLVDAGSSISYATQHLKGAVYADLNMDMAAVPDDPANGGRHPLPTPEDFGGVLSRLGITPQRHVVVYDDKGGALSAARFWWMLRAAGHEKVQVLNGGLSGAAKAGFPLSDVVEMRIPSAQYVFTAWNLPTCTLQDVEAARRSGNAVIIDVRDPSRYNGSVEPLDRIAGHIPGALNVPYATNLDENGCFPDKEEMLTKYTGILNGIPSYDAIVHCGSGVTACHTVLAMAHAGLPFPKLYVGSWSEWSSNNRDVATAENQSG